MIEGIYTALGDKKDIKVSVIFFYYITLYIHADDRCNKL